MWMMKVFISIGIILITLKMQSKHVESLAAIKPIKWPVEGEKDRNKRAIPLNGITWYTYK